MRISDWSSDVCSSDLPDVGNGKGPTRADSTPTVLTTTELPSRPALGFGYRGELHSDDLVHLRARDYDPSTGAFTTRDPLDGVNGTTTVANPYHYAENDPLNRTDRSEEHTSELQSLMRISYAVFCLKTKKTKQNTNRYTTS